MDDNDVGSKVPSWRFAKIFLTNLFLFKLSWKISGKNREIRFENWKKKFSEKSIFKSENQISKQKIESNTEIGRAFDRSSSTYFRLASSLQKSL